MKIQLHYPSFWHKKTILSYLLWPCAYIFSGIALPRRFFYQKIKTPEKFSVPVIVVGNITVGGTGKTPLVIWLANFLKQQGYRPAIISRGYKSVAPYYPYLVESKTDPKISGDEALLIARHTQCPVMIDAKRVRAVKKILNTTDCNIIVSDDGLQHYALHRDVEIAIVDGERSFDNDFMLPAGPLREPLSRLKQVNFVICNGEKKPEGIDISYVMQLIPQQFINLADPNIKVLPESFKNKKLHAVAAIGNPQRFFNVLHAMGLNFTPHAFPDHHDFQNSDLDFGMDAVILMTEKDAVKCEKFADECYWYLPVQAQLPEEFGEAVIAAKNKKV